MIEEVRVLSDLGGREFDARFYDYFMDELEKEEKDVKNRVKKDSRLRYALISFLKKTKHNLCGDIHDLLVDLDKLPNMECDPITLDYREYAKRTVDLVDCLRDLLDRTVGNRPVTKFCFCGSSSRVPAVLKMYREFAMRRGRFSEVVQADETVARGMCYWGFLHSVDVPKVKSIPVMLNRKVLVDRMEELRKWRTRRETEAEKELLPLETFDMSAEARRLKAEGDKEWVKVNEETEKRKNLTTQYQDSVKKCRELLDE